MWNFIGEEAIPKVNEREPIPPQRLTICNLGYLDTWVERQKKSAGVVVLLMVCQSSIEVWTM
jgi:hypothetical protein